MDESNISSFCSDLDCLFINCGSNYINNNDGSNYALIEAFKQKFCNILIDDNIIIKYDKIDKEIVCVLQKHFNDMKKDYFFNICFDLFEFFFKLYNMDKFQNKKEILYLIYNKNINSENKIIELFLTIGRNKIITEFNLTSNILNNNLNNFLDCLIAQILINCDSKTLFIQANLLLTFRNKNSFLSTKILLINLFISIKLVNNFKIFNNLLSNIINLIQPESQLFSKKLNDEIYNNEFADFDYNINDTARKMSKKEYDFLVENFFILITITIDILSSDKNCGDKIFCDFSKKETRKNYYHLLELKIEKEKKEYTENEINIYKHYLLMSFICDIIEFIFSNLHYINNDFNTNDSICIDWNIFSHYKDNNQPKYYSIFIKQLLTVFDKQNLFFVNEIFLQLIELKSNKNELFNELNQKGDEIYSIIEPFNQIGFAVIFWLVWKSNVNLFIQPYSNIYLFDSILPIIAALIKIQQNFKYFGFELLFYLLDLVNECIIKDLRDLKNYSYEDVYKDLSQFIGGPEIDKKRQYVSKNIIKYIQILTNEAKRQFFDFLLKDMLKLNASINDAEVCYAINLLKLSLSNEVNRNSCNTFFEEKFLKEIVNVILNENLFIVDVFETISQGLNFYQFVLLVDKRTFNGKFKIYNKSYVHFIRDKIDILAKLILKWINMNDIEKMKHVQIDTSQLNLNNKNQKDELKKSFELRKNQALLTLNMINSIEKLNDELIKELN